MAILFSLLGIAIMAGVMVLLWKKLPGSRHETAPDAPRPDVTRTTGVTQPEAPPPKPAPQRVHHVVCPFCYTNFSPYNVRFAFDVGGVVRYISANPNAQATQAALDTKALLENNGLYGRIKQNENGMPVVCELISKADGITQYKSRVRVCANEECNQVLSSKAGTYPPDNGLFVIGLRSSGKTVYITSAIYSLKYIMPQVFRCNINAYNAGVETEYETNYRRVMFDMRKLPDATVKAAQLTYEVESDSHDRTVGITFSDIKGEMSDNVSALLVDANMVKVIDHSNYFLLTLDLTDSKPESTANIINHVLSHATVESKKGKYLAVVITKSDALADKINDPVFYRVNNSPGSPIYNSIHYTEKEFKEERSLISGMLRDYLLSVPSLAGIVTAAESVFLRENINYFAVSALGHEPSENGLGSIMPIRVEEPIVWLLNNSGILDWRSVR